MSKLNEKDQLEAKTVEPPGKRPSSPVGDTFIKLGFLIGIRANESPSGWPTDQPFHLLGFVRLDEFGELTDEWGIEVGAILPSNVKCWPRRAVDRNG